MNFLPFSYNWLIKKNLADTPLKTILDLGCGEGSFGVRFNQNNKYKLTGSDIFTPYLKKSLLTKKYFKIIKTDLTKKLSFPDKSFDAVICLETIEHLKKADGLRLLQEIERIAKKKIIISCPVGLATQENFDQNIYQEHLSSWYPVEFIKMGFKVFGIGLKIVYGKHTHVNHKIKLYTAPFYFLSFLSNPIANIFPQIGCQMIAIKKLKNDK